METTSAFIFASPDVYPLAIEPHKSPAVLRALGCANALIEGRINPRDVVASRMNLPSDLHSLFAGVHFGYDGEDCLFLFFGEGDDFVDLRYRPSENAVLLYKRGALRGGKIVEEQWDMALPLHFV